MITVGLLGCFGVAALILGLLLGAKAWGTEVAYRRLAWLPVTALVIEFALAKPALLRLSYFAIVPPILTCLLSLFFAVVGATLVAPARERNEPFSGLVRATIVAGIPGILLVAYMIYGFVVTWVWRRGI